MLKTDNFMTRDFSPLIERVLAVVKAIVSIEKLKLVLGLRYIGTKKCNYYAMF